jgi:hypothetical protein
VKKLKYSPSPEIPSPSTGEGKGGGDFREFFTPSERGTRRFWPKDKKERIQ